MNSFYGGPPGRSFYIKQIFRSKVELVEDLDKHWSSQIGVGDYVFVSYGLPSDGETDDYDTNREKDTAKWGKTYNATLWQKVNLTSKEQIPNLEVQYIENETVSADFGLGYRLITSCSGNTPNIQLITLVDLVAESAPKLDVDMSNIDKPVFTLHLAQPLLWKTTKQILDADAEPTVTLTKTPSTDKPNPAVLDFGLPQSQVLQQLPGDTLNANEKPKVTYDDKTDINKPTLKIDLPQSQVLQTPQIELVDREDPAAAVDITTDINKPKWKIQIPWLQTYNVTTEILDAGNEPVVEVKDLDKNNPSIIIKVPKGQKLKLLPGDVLDANAKPVITYDDTTDVNNPTLKIDLPQSQVMQQPTVTTLAPSEAPTATLDFTNVNKPFLKLGLPRAVEFTYGDKLGEKDAGQYELDEPTMKTGDYYINQSTGYIYKVIEELTDKVKVEWVACIYVPLPIVQSYTTTDGDTSVYSVDYINGLIKDATITTDKTKKTYSARYIDEQINNHCMQWIDL